MPDNCKTAVIHTNLYNPELNHAYRDLARHYQVAIIPARVKKPRDKPTVESGVGWLETWLLEWLKDKIYHSFEALNADIKDRVLEFAERPFKHRSGSRSSNFIALDKPALRPLPKDPFEYYETLPVKTVPNNYHVYYDGFYYSGDKGVRLLYAITNNPLRQYAFVKQPNTYNCTSKRLLFLYFVTKIEFYQFVFNIL